MREIKNVISVLYFLKNFQSHSISLIKQTCQMDSLDSKYDFLKKIVDLLFEEKAFVTHDDSRHSIVNFKYPAELEVFNNKKMH